jgi:phosphoglycerate dehydrogenase-like enzyme
VTDLARRFPVIHVCLDGVGVEESALVEPLARSGAQVVSVTQTTLLERLPEVEVLLCADAPRIDWSPARRLRLLQLMGSGVDTLWPAEGLAEEVAIANARGIHLPEMRDHALAMILAFERRLPRILSQQARGEWSRFSAGTVAGKTVGILGLGEVGRSLALACAALGMRVVGTRTSARPTPGVDEVVPPEAIERVLAAADYLVVAVPLTPETRGMLGAEALSKLRPNAVVVNIARGGVIDEGALDAALRGGKLRGAALDVFETEPLPAESPLWSTPNLVVSPHIAGQVPHYVRRALALFLENLDLVERGLPPRTQVDRRRGY